MALTDSILAYWRLDDDGSGGVSLADSTGNGYSLINSGSVSLGTGLIDGAAITNGSSLVLPSSSYGTDWQVFSLSLWVKTTSASEICGSWAGGGQFVINSTNYPTYDKRFGVSLFNENGISSNLSSSVNATDDNWHHLVLTIDGTTATFYVDGVEQDSRTIDYISLNQRDFLLGNINNLGWQGQIDEVGVWSRAISANEVYNLYYNGGGQAYPFTLPTITQFPTGVVAYWKLDDDGSGGVSLADSTGNGYTLTNNNGVALGSGILSSGCASHDGSNYLSATGSTLTKCSFSFWFNFTDASAPSLGVGTGYPSGFRILSIGSDLYFQSPSASVCVTSGTAYNDGMWHHAVGTFDGSTISLYVDGAYIASNSFSGMSFGDFKIGNGGDFSATAGTLIDEVGVWNRALSESEIATIYNNGDGFSPTSFPPPNGGGGSKPDGWDYDTNTYYLGGLATDLDYLGRGYWNGQWLAEGWPWYGTIYGANYLGLGVGWAADLYDGYPFANPYYIYDYFGATYVGRPSLGLTYPFEANGWIDLDPDTAYYINGYATTLDQDGSGTWNGDTYVNGVIDNTLNGWIGGIFYTDDVATGVLISSLPTQAQVELGVTYGNGLTGTLQSSGGSSTPTSFNIGQLIGLPPFIQL